VCQQRVDHHVADEEHLVFSDAFAAEVLHPRRLGHEQQIRNLVGQHAVDLFRHIAIEAAQAGFDMCDPDAALASDKGAGDRRVYVANHHYRIRFPLDDDRLERGHDGGRLSCMRIGSDLQVDGGARQSELLEEDS
jgi:hypothetical protein